MSEDDVKLLETSHGKERPALPRVGVRGGDVRDELPPAPTGNAAADRDARTGRFSRGNTASRRRRAKALAKALPGLDPSKCEPWLQPFARLAVDHAAQLVADLPVQSAGLNALASDAAAALGVFRALVALGSQGDRRALTEARAWLREHRQSMIALTALARDASAKREDVDAPWLVPASDPPGVPSIASARADVPGSTDTINPPENGSDGGSS